jgi:hypothetical protein
MNVQRPDIHAGIALATWDAEGGAQPGLTAAPPNAKLLQSLGVALLLQWGRLPMPTKRALYGHAVADARSIGDASAKRDIAIFLHRNQGRTRDV